MSFFEKPNRKNYHKRNIEVNSYEYDEHRLVIEGCLTDHRFQEFYPATREKRPPGIIHQMMIHLLVNKTTLEIEDVHAEMPVVPHEACLETIHSVDSVKGLRVTRGFTAKVKALVGSGKGCHHLVALLTSMGPSAVQGYAAYNEQKAPHFLWAMNNMPVNTCWTWRADGPLINLIKKNEAKHQMNRQDGHE